MFIYFIGKERIGMQYDLQKIGRIIRYERKKHDTWTQEKFGDMLGVTGKQVSNYENGKLLPPQDILLKMAELFNCEYGYLLGEESYKDRSKLNTAVCDFMGLSNRSVESIRAATHKGLTAELGDRQFAINSFFESPYFGRFIDCLVDAVDISKRLTAFNDALSQELINRYGEKIVTQATIYCSFSDAVPASITSDPHFQEVVKEIEAAIDKGRNQEYAQKVARYELREAFEHLIRGIQQ